MTTTEIVIESFSKMWQKSPGIVVALTGLSASLVVGLLYSFSGNKDLDESDEPCLSEAETVSIMSSFLDKLRISGQKLNDHADQFRKQAAAQGQQIDEGQLLKAFLFPNFENILVELDSHVLQEHDLEESELKHAVNHYINEGNPKLKQICKKLNQLYKDFGGELDDEEYDESTQSQVGNYMLAKDILSSASTGKGLTKEMFLQVLELLTHAIAEHANDFLTHFKTTYGNKLENENIMIFQQGFLTVQEKATAKALGASGITESEFHAAIEKFHTHREVEVAMATMQEIVPQIMAVHGFGMQQ